MERLLRPILILSLYFCSYETKKLPSFIQKCSLNDPQVNDCILQRIEELKPRLLNGIPELKIPPIAPLKLSKIDIEKDSQFKVTFSDIIADGAEDFQLKSLNFDFKNRKIDLNIYLPKLITRVKYRFEGKVLMLQLSSSGMGQINITNADVNVHINFDLKSKKEKEYIVISSKVEILMKRDDSKVYFDNLFNGNEQLTIETNRLLNENINEFEKDIRPVIDRTIYEFITGIVLNVFQEYSIQELFL